MTEVNGDVENNQIIFIEDQDNRFNIGRDLIPDHPSRKSNGSEGSGKDSPDVDNGNVIQFPKPTDKKPVA